MTDQSRTAGIRHPDCPSPNACRIRKGLVETTLMAWQPTYDGDGNQLDADPNTRQQSMWCSVCRKSWKHVTRRGVVKYE